jgi:hypothetical protein
MSGVGKGFWYYVNKTSTCWLWTGATQQGYGVHTSGGRAHKAHRVSYEEIVGPIPEGLTIDHLCRVRNCVNPDHLEPVSQKVNTLRGITIPALNAAKTSCVNGHAFDEGNTYIRPDGARGCRRCRTAAGLRYYYRNKPARI